MLVADHLNEQVSTNPHLLRVFLLFAEPKNVGLLLDQARSLTYEPPLMDARLVLTAE